jgi:hypothetical protein
MCNLAVKLRGKIGIMKTNNYCTEAGDTKIISIKNSKITFPIERY